MKNINCKSDFKIKETIERADVSIPFVYSYFVYSNKKYVASFDGEKYVNCHRNDDDSITVIFDNHNLGVGALKVERKCLVRDADFADGVWQIVSVEETGINLTNGQTDEIDFSTVVIPPYIKGDKGDSLTWATMSESEKTELIQDLGDKIDASLIVTSETEDKTDYNDVF